MTETDGFMQFSALASHKSIENTRILASFVKVMNVLNVVLSYTRNPDLQFFTRRNF